MGLERLTLPRVLGTILLAFSGAHNHMLDDTRASGAELLSRGAQELTQRGNSGAHELRLPRTLLRPRPCRWIPALRARLCLNKQLVHLQTLCGGRPQQPKHYAFRRLSL